MSIVPFYNNALSRISSQPTLQGGPTYNEDLNDDGGDFWNSVKNVAGIFRRELAARVGALAYGALNNIGSARPYQSSSQFEQEYQTLQNMAARPIQPLGTYQPLGAFKIPQVYQPQPQRPLRQRLVPVQPYQSINWNQPPQHNQYVTRQQRINSIGHVMQQNNPNNRLTQHHRRGKFESGVVANEPQSTLMGRVSRGINHFISPSAYGASMPRQARGLSPAEEQYYLSKAGKPDNTDALIASQPNQNFLRQSARAYQYIQSPYANHAAQLRAEQARQRASDEQRRRRAEARRSSEKMRQEMNIPEHTVIPDMDIRIEFPVLHAELKKRKLINTRPLNENANLHYAIKQNNRTQYQPPMAALDPGLALYHYIHGEGRPLTVQMRDIRIENIKRHEDMYDFKNVVKVMRHQGIKKLDMNSRKISFQVSNLLDKASLGNITVELTGTVLLTSPRRWEFQGIITSNPSLNDKYDFNPSTHRSGLGEASTIVGSQIPGTEYEVIIEGEQKFEISGYY
jgi:hypothetical protein